MRAIIVALVVSVLCMSQPAKAEEVFGPDTVADAVAADVTEVVVPVVVPEVVAPAPAPVEAPAESSFKISFDLAEVWDALRGFIVEILRLAWDGLVVGGVTWGLCKLVGSARALEVQKAMKISAAYTWDNMGRALKNELKGGKFDSDHRAKLLNYAYEHTKTLLKGAVLKLFESYGPGTTTAMFSDIVEKRKAIASMGKTNAVASIPA